jgi:hypothetical protein
MDRHSKLTPHPSASLTATCNSIPAIAWEFVALPVTLGSKRFSNHFWTLT